MVLETGAAPTPVEIFKGIVMERRYLETIHKEVDPIIPRQVVDAAAQGAKWIKVICDNKDVFILWTHYLPTNKAYCYAIVLWQWWHRPG